MTINFSDERRTFLKNVALLGGAVACVPLAKKTAAAGNPPQPPPEKSGQGYKVTEHISKYYQTARI